MFRVSRWAILPVVALGPILLTPPALADEYLISPGDELDLSVFARPDLSRIYRVRSDGTISMHIVGTIPAAGRTPAKLEQEVEALLATAFSDSESVTLEVASYVPIIVSGDVENPGNVPFQAGIDVRSAVAISGGMADPANLDNTSSRMRVSDELANAEVLSKRLAALQVTRARLIAARDGDTTMEISDEVQKQLDENQAEPLVTAAATLLAALGEVQDARRQAQGDQLRLAREEAEAFAERRTLLNNQLDTLLKALADQQNLRDRGLARSDRVVQLTLDTSRLRVDILESIGLEAAARQKLERAASAPATDETQLRADLSGLLAETEAAILETSTRLERSRAFVREFASSADIAEEFDVSVTYRIYRRNGEATEVVEAGPDTRLHPGDGLEVVRMVDIPGAP
ncbi:MAG: polysaccharide biosynthesis/export family protein [Paracoccus sp. (in: a-proteobacteria)]|uniref:polysaccharide biosynthesis/export family protein n=1 Tax=unclassified Paracoccus (in: a-proteobacteria) TaxID=2688777 RepID=UPI002372469F|nr:MULTISPECIES: polysaccharide biosynthesis/export family protein [unclassified Paracoccus (in: a-proteobacteria)]MCS5603427.1 polysaccharide biosynthesis/export family protein [Paracoccus sp. (in: a-proteobacteria)]MDB2552164.1 polysaccharide biosynthesis/export family protein [Paracoccus sp. (in: a-proteobacteria)]